MKRPRTSKRNTVRTKAATRRPPAARKGPVTLSQARALAKLKVPPSPAKAALIGASPASVGAERKRLEMKQRAEIRRRIREYKATLEIMKKRGVKGLAQKAKTRRASAKAARGPLQILAEGDSWFDYPVPFFGGSIIPRLETEDRRTHTQPGQGRRRSPIHARCRGAHAPHRSNSSGAPRRGGKWDVLLFSGAATISWVTRWCCGSRTGATASPSRTIFISPGSMRPWNS